MRSRAARSGALALALACGAVACATSGPEPRAASVPAAATAPAPPVETAPASAPPGSLATKESKAVLRTLTRVSEIRGIPATRGVPGVKLERDQLVARVKDKALREFPADALRREGQLLQLLGFAPPAFDYLNEMMKLLEAQLEGFYEPSNGTMYLAADLRGKEAQATLAHELVHALQDQKWDLKARSSYRPGKGDETLALACLAEGDATSLMMDFILAEKGQTALDLPENTVRELMASGMTGPAIASVPHILRTTLVAPYIDGLTFVHALRKKAGWPMVDRVWAQPPTTTEQVLHVEKWESHEAALPISVPTAKSLGTGWSMVDEDTFGELGFALTFEEWLDPKDARIAAAGWGGDRSGVYTKGDEIAFAVQVRYDDSSAGGHAADAFAQRAFGKLGPGLKRKLGRPLLETPDTLCFERKELGPLIVARRDRNLVLASGPARATRSGSWTGTSTCAVAKQWALEILSAP